jgi:uncharacterized membrane protein YjgN (DUF898 family)
MPYVNLSGSSGPHYYDGDVVGWMGVFMPSVLMCVLTLGLAYPYARCFFLSWYISCLVIDGKRLSFHGTWQELYPVWCKGVVLTILTLGLYYPWMYTNLRKWEYSHVKSSD